jgi:hypothetical protein
MTRLVKAFFDIALWRKTPAALPASSFLLALTALAAALVEGLGDSLPPGPRNAILLRVVLAVIVPLCFSWTVLALTKRRQRFLQTGSAMLGVGVMARMVLYPLDAAIRMVGVDRPWAPPLFVVLFAGYIGYLLAGVNIWRAALDSGVVLGGVVSVAYFLLQLFLEQQLLSTA